MKFQFNLVERFREHSARHAQADRKYGNKVALSAPSPYALGLATATEQELQRFAEHIESKYARKVSEDHA